MCRIMDKKLKQANKGEKKQSLPDSTISLKQIIYKLDEDNKNEQQPDEDDIGGGDGGELNPNTDQLRPQIIDLNYWKNQSKLIED